MKKIFFLALVVLASSCVKLKDRIYFQDGNFSDSTTTFIKNQNSTYKIQAKDILSVDVYASNLADIEPLRKDLQSSIATGNAATGGGLYLRGYVVDEKGNISMPGGVGDITVAGLTLEEAKEVIKSKITILKEFIVEVKLLNFNVSVLGEVTRPGQYQIFQERFSLLQGLAMAGDLTDFANRRNVRLIRQRPDGVEVKTIDLTKSNLLNSEYFFLHPNDAIYVEPLKADTKRNNLPVLGTIFAGASAIVLIANLIVNISK
ncbi:MAG: polysaccharide biosynthesis/export family protein [Microscillaceae bacterium]|nr:polysaccharide biosynthesis/export family protein [Microscillaceae bacterium]